VARLAAHYADGTITGGRARCVALLHTLKLVISDFKTPKNTKYAHALTSLVNGVVQHLQAARPMAVSMGNAVKSLKTHLARMAEDAVPTEEEARARTLKHLEYFEREKLVAAGGFIAEHGSSEICDGDVVVTHGASHHVREILLKAKAKGVRFTVTVVDSRPNLEGRDTLRVLLRAGVDCTYVTLPGLGYVLTKGGATKVLIGAAAVLANGAVVSRVGTAAVAAVARGAGIPVLVAAETCKFHERVQLDAVANNELGNPAAVASTTSYPAAYGHGGRNPSLGRWVGRSGVRGDVAGGSMSVEAPGASGGDDDEGGERRREGLEGWEKVERLSVLNLTYDVTPAECITSVVCESGLVAPTDVPSFLR
jgi:translation initiation factor eIF-2B subunit delta